MGRIRIGCSGWNYAHWRETVYGGAPVRGWLQLYAARFDTVEVNATFYRLPRPTSAARWAEQTRSGFLFAVKASRYLTHVRRLREIADGVERFYASIEPLRETQKLGPVLWQLPPRFRRDDERLAATLQALPSGRHAFEFRDPSWFADEVYALLREHRAALVIADRKGLDYQTHELTADWTYIRFHEGRRGARGNYSGAELREWAARIRRWSRDCDIYAYFNNDWEGFAVRNAETLAGLL
jgi:uncharacterized protein YecE (DUF72 family)